MLLDAGAGPNVATEEYGVKQEERWSLDGKQRRTVGAEWYRTLL